jgi:DNA invertase Pin-like site-specific DNA recombinase
MKGAKNKKLKINKVTKNRIDRLIAKGVKKTEIAKQLNISRNSIYVYLRSKKIEDD